MDTVAPSIDNCCAVIISYNADAYFFERVDLICAQFRCVLIIDNGSAPVFQKRLQAYQPQNALGHCHSILNSHNTGIAKALNQGIAYAVAEGFDWLISFDQDSRVEPMLFSELIRIYEQASIKPLILGCNYFHEALNRPAVGSAQAVSCIERLTLISSGMLLWLQLPEQIGGFREDYFIDSVDHEFALRVRRAGYRVWMSTRVLMRHSIGRTATFKRPALFRIPEHSALRKYYITRNCLVTAVNYCRQEPLWSLKQLARLLLELLTIVLYETAKIQKIRAMALGVVHACTHKMGELTDCAWIMPDSERAYEQTS